MKKLLLILACITAITLDAQTNHLPGCGSYLGEQWKHDSINPSIPKVSFTNNTESPLTISFNYTGGSPDGNPLVSYNGDPKCTNTDGCSSQDGLTGTANVNPGDTIEALATCSEATAGGQTVKLANIQVDGLEHVFLTYDQIMNSLTSSGEYQYPEKNFAITGAEGNYIATPSQSGFGNEVQSQSFDSIRGKMASKSHWERRA